MNWFAIIISSFLIYQVQSYGRSLGDCQAVAAMFDNTCSSTSAITLSSHSGQTMSCSGEMRCPEGNSLQTFTATSPCTWTRKLCVTC